MNIADVGVVILAYGRGNEHEPLVADLAANGVKPHQIYIAHNPDRPRDGWRPVAPQGALVQMHRRNIGYSAAMNSGIEHFRKSGAPLVLLVTHDARLDPTALEALVEAAGREPDYGVLGLAVRGAGGATVSYGSRMPANGVVRHITQLPPGTRLLEVPWVDGCAMLLRLEAVSTRPLPEKYFMYFEEAVLCSEVRLRGWRVGTVVDAQASSVSGIKNRRASFYYLYLRNGFDWVWRYCGRRRAMGFAVREAGRAFTEFPKPGGRYFADPDIRRVGLLMLRARGLALVDIARRRWGPPPPLILRGSDVRSA